MNRWFYVAACATIAANIAFFPVAALVTIWEPSATHRIDEMMKLGASTLLGLATITFILAFVAPPPRRATGPTR